MADFTGRPLTLLDRIYRFTGGLRGVRAVDLVSDITLVHDVSRQAERTGFGPFFGRVNWSRDLVNSGAATSERLILRTSIGPLLGYEDERYELYLLHAHAQCTLADIADIDHISFVMGKDANSVGGGKEQEFLELGIPQDQAAPVAYWPAAVPSATSVGAAWGGVSTAEKWHRPIQTEAGGFICWQLKSSAAATIGFTTEMWAGPLGSTPPGLP